jgi:hypothetical protein
MKGKVASCNEEAHDVMKKDVLYVGRKSGE